VTDNEDALGFIVRMLIAALCMAALLLIGVIVSGSKLDDTSGKTIATAIGFAFYSLTSMAGLSLAARRQSMAPFGYTVAVVSIAAFLTGAAAFWLGGNSDRWELPGILLILALGGGHASLLLKGSRETDADAVSAIRVGVLLAIAALCLMAVAEITSDGDQIDPRAFGVFAVLYLLGTVLLPLVRRSSDPPMPATSPSAADLLRHHGHVLVEGPVRRGGVHGDGRNVCLREPDGTLVEVITYGAEGSTSTDEAVS
jgi:drug/metabolite transporter (DMT)-like permease